MPVKLGILSKTYRNTATYGTPTWSEVTCISDWQIGGTWDTVEANTRATRVKSGAKTMYSIDVSGKIKQSDTDANYLAFLGALLGSTLSLDLMILNGDRTTNGVTGIRANYIVTKGDDDQGLGAALFRDIALMPDAYTAAGEQPSSVVVTSGAPVFTAI